MKKHWYDYLWIVTIIYLGLGFFNILFSWIGLIFFLLPLMLSIGGKDKIYCNRYCDRGQLLALLGGRVGLSRKKDIPRWMRTKAFRYGFLAFFLIMFMQMLLTTWMVFSTAGSAREVVTLLWTFKVPWSWAYPVAVAPWVAQFAFGFYSLMLTSTLIGLFIMVLFKPRAWCVFCPMGTMTQLICKTRVKIKEK